MGTRALKPKRKKVKPHRGKCTATKRCEERGGEMFHCVTCENLRDAGKLEDDKVFRIQTCVPHRDHAVVRMKRHALVAHPVNILRVTVAALKGEL